MGQFPSQVVIAKHEQESFDTMVNYYFPGEELYIKDPARWKRRRDGRDDY